MKSINIWTGCVTLAMATAVSDGALAQVGPTQPTPLTPAQPEAATFGETVATRRRPELEPLGIRAGSFLIFPNFAVEETFNDNVLASKHNKKSDFVTDLVPQVAVESNWANHALNLRAGADAGYYADVTRLDYTDYFAAIDGRVDITRDSALFAGGGYAHQHEDPGQPNAATDAKQPTEYDYFNGFARYVQKVGRIRGIADTSFQRLDYDKTNTVSGAELNNTGRDRNVYAGGLRIGYELQPHYEAFVRGEGNKRDYDRKIDEGGVERSSEGYTAVGGLALDLGGVTFGEVYAGYLQQFYDSNQLNTISGLTAGGTLTWNVTTLTTINARAARIVEETTQLGSSGILRTTGGISADHELLRNLILSAAFNITNDDYQDVKRTDYYYIPGISARYLMNRNLYATLGYQFVHHTTDGRDTTDQSYDQNVVRIGLEAQL